MVRSPGASHAALQRKANIVIWSQLWSRSPPRLTIAFVAVCSGPVCSAQEASLSVATYNINWGNQNIPLMLKTIGQVDADVLCLQETTATTEAALRRRFSDRYAVIRFRGYNGRFAAERFGLLSKHPISEFEFHPPAGRYFGAVTFTATCNGKTIRFANVHLAPFTVRRGSSTIQLMKQLALTEVEHKKEADAIAELVNSKAPTIVMGDFNSLSYFYATTQLKQLGFVDSFAAVTQDADSHFTWSWPLGAGRARLRIDYIYHSSHFTTKSSTVFAADASDHRLVASSLTSSAAVD